MAVTQATLRALRELQVMIDSHVDTATRALVSAWADAWQEISDEFTSAIEDLIELGEGDWPTRGQVLRAQSAINAMKVGGDALTVLGEQAGVTITAGLPLLVGEVDRIQELIARTQFPVRGAPVAWTPTGDRALNAIVQRTTQRVTSLTLPLSRQSDAVMRSVLIRGVAVGDNPRRAAREMMRRTQGAFEGGLHRATTIARTEMIDSSRAAALESRQANAGVLTGWRWSCTLGPRTCPACLSLDGTTYGVDEPGPNGHPNCRCTAMPITRSWAELGIDLDEPPPVDQPTGREWFAEQPARVQQRVMGKNRLAALNSGRIGWDDMATLRHNSGWRDSWQVAALN